MFKAIEEFLYPIVCDINLYLSNYLLVFLLLGVGIWYTWKTKFVQVRCFKEGFKQVFGSITLKGKKEQHGMSSFQALTTAIAAQVGTGNIVGSSGAILIGGPGAIFWMWVIAFFGMATIYAEATLALKTRVVKKDGTIYGGPVYYIRTAFKGKLGKYMAAFFAIAIVFALGFMGCMVQANSISSTFETAFHIPPVFIGIILIIACGFVFLSDLHRLATIVEKIVPIMAIIFLSGAIFILLNRLAYLPETFSMIISYAFSPQAIIGGSFGYALKETISQGAKRGLFSNEAGMGSTPHAHAQADVKHPHEQGVVAIIGVFLDTFVVLTLNALVIISTLYTSDGPLHACGAAAAQTVLNKTNLAQAAFSSVMGDQIGAAFVAICLLFFSFSTAISWNMFGKINIAYLFGKKAIPVYSIISLLFIFTGTLVSNDFVWELTDLFNNMMVIPNTLALFALTGMVVHSLKERKNGAH